MEALEHFEGASRQILELEAQKDKALHSVTVTCHCGTKSPLLQASRTPDGGIYICRSCTKALKAHNRFTIAKARAHTAAITRGKH